MIRANLKISLGIALIVIGALVIPASILIPALKAPAEEVVFEVPGRASLDVEAPGRFYLWHDYITVDEGRQVLNDEKLPAGMTFKVIRADDGSTLTFEPRINIHTEIGSAESRSIGFVDIERPGRFRIEVFGGDDQVRTMSFSRSRFMLLTGAIGFSVLSLIIAGIAGVVLIVLGIAQRAGKT